MNLDTNTIPSAFTAPPAADAKGSVRLAFRRKLLILLCALVICVLCAGGVWITVNAKPTLSIRPPESLSASERGAFTVDIMLSDLPDYLYPAASVAVAFDKNKLEFLGVQMGNMMTYDSFIPGKDEGEPRFDIPVWNCSPQAANRDGEVRAIYVDMTAEKNAYGIAGYDKASANIPLRLSFCLRDSATPGDLLEFTFNDAVFATTTGAQDHTSLSMSEKYQTLKVESGKLKLS